MIKEIKKDEVKFLMTFDYNNVLGRLKLVLGTKVSFFADVRVKQSGITWYIPNDCSYIPLSTAEEDIFIAGKEALRNKLEELRSIIELDSLLAPHTDSILSYPSEDFVFFHQDKDDFNFVLTGWGCQLLNTNAIQEKKETMNETKDDDVDDEIQEIKFTKERFPDAELKTNSDQEFQIMEDTKNNQNNTSSYVNNLNQSEDSELEEGFGIPMTFSRAISTCFSNYANFSGRATRSEYWYFALFNFLINISFFTITYIAAYNGSSSTVGIISIISIIYSLAVLLPSLAVSVRRLHDTGRSGWWFLINLVFICYIGPIWFIVLMCKDTDDGENEYGPVPDDYYV